MKKSVISSVSINSCGLQITKVTLPPLPTSHVRHRQLSPTPPRPVSIFKYPFPILRRCPTYTPFRSSVRSRRCPVRNAVCLGLPVHLLQFIDRGSKLRFLRWLRRFSKCNNDVFINRQTQFTITISTGLWQMRHAIGDEQSLPRRPSPPPPPLFFQ